MHRHVEPPDYIVKIKRHRRLIGQENKKGQYEGLDEKISFLHMLHDNKKSRKSEQDTGLLVRAIRIDITLAKKLVGARRIRLKFGIDRGSLKKLF